MLGLGAWPRWLKDLCVLIFKPLAAPLKLMTGLTERTHQSRQSAGAKEEDEQATNEEYFCHPRHRRLLEMGAETHTQRVLIRDIAGRWLDSVCLHDGQVVLEG